MPLTQTTALPSHRLEIEEDLLSAHGGRQLESLAIPSGPLVIPHAAAVLAQNLQAVREVDGFPGGIVRTDFLCASGIGFEETPAGIKVEHPARAVGHAVKAGGGELGRCVGPGAP